MLLTLATHKVGSVLASLTVRDTAALIALLLTPLAVDFTDLSLGNDRDETWM